MPHPTMKIQVPDASSADLKRKTASAPLSPSTRALPPFIAKLVEILDCGPQHLVRWTASGNSFLVQDKRSFCKEVLAVHFKSDNFQSFIRQLNFYGFHKQNTSGKGIWEFSHDQFIRGRLDLMHCIKRRTSSDYQPPSAITDVEAVHSLKREVETYKDEVSDLRHELKSATAMIQELQTAVLMLRQGHSVLPNITTVKAEAVRNSEASRPSKRQRSSSYDSSSEHSSTPRDSAYSSGSSDYESDESDLLPMLNHDDWPQVNESEVFAPEHVALPPPAPLVRSASQDAVFFGNRYFPTVVQPEHDWDHHASTVIPMHLMMTSSAAPMMSMPAQHSIQSL